MGARRIRPPHDPAADERVKLLNRRERWAFEGRRYFRFPDGRLGSTGYHGGMRVELDDPDTAKHYVERMKEVYSRYDIVDGRLALTKEGRRLEAEEAKEKEFEKTLPPKWYDAKEFEPDRTGTYKCVVQKGWIRKRKDETDVYFRRRTFTGDWLTRFGVKVIEWRENK